MEVNSNMSDKDTKEKKADVLLAETVKSVKDRMDRFEKDKEKTNEEVLNLSEWKTFQDKYTADIENLDNGIKGLSAPPLTDKELEKKDYESLNNTLKYAGMKAASGEKFHNLENFKPDSEEKALQVNNDVRAGYLQVPPEYIREIIDQAMHEYSPVRSLARVITTVSNRIQIPAQSAHGICSWVAEAGTTSEDETPEYALEDIPVHKATALYKATIEMLDDSAFNLQAEMRNDYSMGMGILEGTAHVNGTGVGQPEGFMVDGGIASVNSENATNITADSLYTTYFTLKEPYTRNATWGMRRATVGIAAAFKGGDGQYLLNMLADSPNFQLLGKDIVQMADMPAVGAGNYPVIFGDFRYYVIVDKAVSQVQIVDPYTSKTTGIVEFLLNWRTGGQTVNSEAFKKIICAVT